MIDRNINSIIYQSYIKLGEIGLNISKNANKGEEGTIIQKKLWNQAIKIDSYLDEILDHIEVKDNSVYRVIGITEDEINQLLSCLRITANIDDFPVASFIPTKDVSQISLGSGSQGTPGVNGVSAYNAVVFASDTNGTGFSTTPSPSLPYVAFKTATAPIPLTLSSFTGLWVKFIGDNGSNGVAGANGITYYTYIRYASDSSGTDFSATPSIARPYVGYLVTTTDFSGNPPSIQFNGLWVKFIGDTGTAGTNGTDGKTIIITSGAPSNAIGSNGDIAIDTTNWFIYAPKAAGVWPAGHSLTGPVGATGATGSAGTNGTNGTNGVNSYIYIAYSDASDGTGYTLVTSNDGTASLSAFNASKEWIAIIISTTQIGGTINQSSFNGLWAKYRGEGDRWSTTSATSVTIGSGTKLFFVETNLAYTTGQRVVAAVSGDPTNRMEGYVINYNSVNGQLSISVDAPIGAGTYNVWDVSLQSSLINIIDTPFINADVDIGTEDVDTFPVASGIEIIWNYHIVKGANAKGGIISATVNGSTINWDNESRTPIGTIDITLDVDINAGNIRLRAIASSNDWIVKGIRRIITT